MRYFAPKKALLLAALLLFLNACAAASNSASPEELCAYPCMVTLHGKLITEHKWGPPNFGETPSKDEKVKVYILALDDTVSVNLSEGGSPDSPKNVVSGVSRIQLDFPVKSEFKKFVGERVVVNGQLLEGLSPSEYTKIVIRVNAVSPESD